MQPDPNVPILLVANKVDLIEGIHEREVISSGINAEYGRFNFYPRTLPMQSPVVVKVVMVGPGDAGKTSIIKRYCYNTFSNNCKATVGADFATKILQLNKQEPPIQLNFWDIAGQERFGASTPVYYRNAQGYLFFFYDDHP
eukprot:TRINITY_DN5575_c0_g1_i3.p1 TRINITY_DN5575_c0_g1~~TRINITY_DN5575_c0_g1_i3.p1  ORF type:complete len:141 (+),score=30.59 TRINITY_DN5575_c0_g1_i3:638-1060(+)